jgi:hypothetical protein
LILLQLLFRLDQSGSSSFRGAVNSPKTNFDLSGASTTEVDGTTTDLVIDASGASNFKGSDFTAVSCKVEATGASSASINVSKESRLPQVVAALSVTTALPPLQTLTLRAARPLKRKAKYFQLSFAR